MSLNIGVIGAGHLGKFHLEKLKSRNDVDLIGFYDKPLLTFDRLLETYISHAPSGLPSFIKSIPVWVREKIFQKNLILSELKDLDLG